MKQTLRCAIALALVAGAVGLCVYHPRLNAETRLTEALYYQKLDKKNVQCRLCPRNCLIPPGRRGFCQARENRDGTLYAMSFGKLVAVHIDPIEKKPLFHFLPGERVFSIAAAGCNLRCKFCQNWEISQKSPEEVSYEYIEPQELVRRAQAAGCRVIAYTYTEPVVFYEYMLATAKLAKAAGIKNVMHSAGYVNEEPLRELARYIDAANIDLKGFSDDYYARMAEGSLAPVLASLQVLKQAGVHLEVTNLLVPGQNDDEGVLIKMSLWIKEKLGADTPLHFARFWPLYKLIALEPTPVESLEKARKIAMDCGLQYVYIGNIPGHAAENTYCPKCKKIIVKRSGYTVLENDIIDGKCKFCGEKIYGVWN